MLSVRIALVREYRRNSGTLRLGVVFGGSSNLKSGRDDV